ncbi:DUF3168 domain-containing protein [Enterococcus casseliflavus]|uniref:tail completion protein gp17 n=1 Tax=Enterococcus casseliflavus TaxID=37734 RepID=UPI002DBDA248|nr:hypothetical protein [Enterococcus casseliflavus]MEB6213525.1 DUF3168 domain-containing protein [Enterococcus casseliflavus]
MINSIELQKAIYSALSKEYKVFEIVPVANSFPYITIGEMSESENFTKTDLNRFTFDITIHGWTVGQSSVKSKEQKDFIYRAMKNLTLTDIKVEQVTLELSQTFKEQGTDKDTIFHSVQEFGITINNKGDNTNGN